MSKVMLITGGSRGIGAATALQAVAQGYAVCINYLRDARAAQLLCQELEARGGRAIAVQADVSVERDVERLFQEVDERLGRLTVLVNSAGTVGQASRLESMDWHRIRQVFATNVFGTVMCCKHAILRMSNKHGGTGGAIVNVSSAASRLGSACEYVDYAASKGAVDSLTIGLAKEVAPDGIRVNAVRPGFIRTDFHALSGDSDRVEKFKSRLPMGRGGEPEEVAAAVLWLLCEQSSYVTGSFIDLAGGL
ncbi:SDR family oxidoreductase [Pseudomonas sp. HR96]|uniref:SDR family oxidoreductase n=1 Tax=Pseudomonas sp. HR96 TaxID=1027966 RepID=UPI002A760D9C|nr:SDR family oxidoreductase [Pseudomonas sp. HR96]WPP00920.1 SDR family oxidoreductase [Pseudomonas sp. HR96]